MVQHFEGLVEGFGDLEGYEELTVYQENTEIHFSLRLVSKVCKESCCTACFQYYNSMKGHKGKFVVAGAFQILILFLVFH